MVRGKRLSCKSIAIACGSTGAGLRLMGAGIYTKVEINSFRKDRHSFFSTSGRPLSSRSGKGASPSARSSQGTLVWGEHKSLVKIKVRVRAAALIYYSNPLLQ